MITRQGFADVLRALGTVIEEITAPASTGDPQNDDREGMQYWLYVDIHEWEAEREWWWEYVASCFPTWSRLGRLSMNFATRQYAFNISPDAFNPS